LRGAIPPWRDRDEAIPSLGALTRGWLRHFVFRNNKNIVKLHQNKNSVAVLILVAILAVFLIVSFSQINDYGVTWDEDLHYKTGEMNIDVFAGNGSIEDINNFSNLRYYGPFADMIGHSFYELFTQKLGWLDTVAGHHVHIILFAALMIGAVYWLAYKTHGQIAAIFATLFLIFFPRFIGHSQVNMKDLPVTAMLTLGLLVLYLAVTKKKAWLFVLGGVIFGLNFSIKVNAVWVPIILVTWFLFAYRDKIWQGLTRRRELGWSAKHGFKSWGWGLLVAPFAAAAAAVATWPWTWPSPISRMLEVVQYLGSFQWEGKIWYQDLIFTVDELPWHYAPVLLFYVTPILLMVFAALGLVLCLKSFITLKNRGEILYVVWFVLALGLVIALDIGLYDGIRHFFMVVPAMVLLGGVAVAWVYGLFKKIPAKSWRRFAYTVFTVVMVFFFGLIFRKMIQIHPYNLYYYNEVIGGMGGAYHYVEVGYWGQEFREGVEWLNEHAEEGARVAILPTDKMGRRYLRDDLILVKETQDPDYAIHVTKTAFEPFKDKEVIYIVEVDGAPLLKVKRVK